MKSYLSEVLLVLITVMSVAVLQSVGAWAAGPEPAGWYAGDMHVHRSCGGSPESVSSVFNKMSTYNISVLSLLADMGNGEVQDPITDLPLVNGQDASVSTSGRILHWDAEWHWDATYSQYPHQALGGHLVCLGLSQAYQIWDEYTYPILDWAHQNNGIAGFAHMEYLDNNIPQSLTCCTPIEYPVETALGASDFISEDVVNANSSGGGLDPESFTQAYYRLLNCGFRPGFAAGTDYPCNDGAAPGDLLTYVQVAGGQLTYRNWIDGIKNGRTVISRNGHNEFLNLTVNGTATPGDEIKLTGGSSVPVTVQWTASQSLSGTIELLKNGVVVASKQTSVTSSSPATLSATVDFTHSGWLAARRMGNNGHVVHTAAVFVTVDNAPVRASASDAQFYVQWMDNLLQKTSPGGVWSSYFPTSRAAAQARYQAAKTMFQQIATEAAALLNITSSSLPDGALGVIYSTTLAASGGTAPYTWSISSGSLPPGLSLDSATGVISGSPTATGTYTFTARVTDSGNPVQTVTQAMGIAVSAQANSTIWSSSSVPGIADSGPDSAVELGVKFRSDVDGSITGIRFYKGSGNTGTHVGNLWSLSGTRLATATFSGETASGWQQVNFSSPVAITANTVYVASYHTNVGHYSEDQNYFAGKGMDSSPLHALADGVSGFNGVYAYGSTSSIPNQGWNSSNYWVDVVFSTATPPAVTLSSIAVTPVNPAISTGATQQFTATGTYSDGSTQNLTGQVSWTSSNTNVATISSAGLATGKTAGTTTISAAASGVTGSTTLTVQASALSITTQSLPAATANVSYSATLTATGGTLPYTWSISAGSLPTGLTLNAGTGVISGTPTATGTFSFTVKATDSGSPAQSATRALSISVAAAQTTVTIWASSSVPGIADSGPDSAVELGVKFRSDVNGSVIGIRFYKGSGNTGTHVGNLWTSAGTRLASATFTGETTSGWQQVNFSSPVVITANTVYVASYHTNVGHYSDDQNYFASTGVDNPPLHALANGVSGFNGVYAYGSSSNFPSQGWNSSNYWVDVVFSANTQPPTLSSISVTPANPTITAGGTQQFTATGTYSDGSTQNITGQVTWNSSNTAVATINSAGLATGVASGSSTISATSGTVTSGTTLTVQGVPVTLSSISVTPANPTINVGATQQFTATGTYSDGSTQNITGQVTWSSSNSGVATISSTGLATGAGMGTSTISASLGGVTGSTTLTVQTQTLTITTASLSSGRVGVSYSTALAASGGTPPYAWSIYSGSLPPGLSLNSASGGISGTPTATGTFRFTLRVTDSSNPVQTATKAFSIRIRR